jgi:hypothetical protein
MKYVVMLALLAGTCNLIGMESLPATHAHQTTPVDSPFASDGKNEKWHQTLDPSIVLGWFTDNKGAWESATLQQGVSLIFAVKKRQKLRYRVTKVRLKVTPFAEIDFTCDSECTSFAYTKPAHPSAFTLRGEARDTRDPGNCSTTKACCKLLKPLEIKNQKDED